MDSGKAQSKSNCLTRQSTEMPATGRCAGQVILAGTTLALFLSAKQGRYPVVPLR